MNGTLEMAPTETIECCAPLDVEGITDEEAEATAKLFKALADPHRVRILNLIANCDEEVCVCEITDAFDLSQPTISWHLKKLVEAGLLRRERRGTWAFFSIDPVAATRLKEVVHLTGGSSERRA